MLAATLAPWFARRGIHYGWVIVALTFVTAVCSSAAMSMPGVLVLSIEREFGWSRGQISVAMALLLVLFGGTAPFAGALMLRYGLRRVVVAGAVLAVLGLGGTMLASQLWHLWVTMGLLLGLAGGTTALVLSATVANRWFAERRGLVMGVLAAAFAAGQLVFMPGVAWLVETQGWRVAMLPALLSVAACGVAYLLLARDFPADIGQPPYGAERVQAPPAVDPRNAVAVTLGVLREGLGNRAFWVIFGTFTICGLSTSGIIGQHFIPLCGDFGMSTVVAASLLATMGVFNFIGTIVSGWLTDRFDCRVLLAWYYGLRGLSLMWLPFSGFDMVGLTIFAIFFGLDFVATIPPTIKLAAQHFGPVKAPIVFGWAFAGHQMGGALSSLAAGVSRDALATYLPAFFMAGAACFIAVGAVFALRDIGRTAGPVAAG